MDGLRMGLIGIETVIRAGQIAADMVARGKGADQVDASEQMEAASEALLVATCERVAGRLADARRALVTASAYAYLAVVQLDDEAQRAGQPIEVTHG